MKITIAFVLIALLATSFGFRVKQGLTDLAADAGAVATATIDAGLEDTETVIDQTIEDTEAGFNCMAGCTEMATWAQCAADCLAASVETVNAQAAADMATAQGQFTGATASA